MGPKECKPAWSAWSAMFPVWLARIFFRPQQADPFLRATHELFFSHKSSIFQVLQHSPALAALFAREVAKCTNAAHRPTKAIAAAKHRVESMRRPRGRFIVFVDAVIGTAEEPRLPYPWSGKVGGQDKGQLATLGPGKCGAAGGGAGWHRRSSQRGLAAFKTQHGSSWGP